MKSGFVAILGRPNSGKSTLINAIIGQKISIVSSKAQTTRNNIRGIYHDDDYEIVFLDTPGIHKSKMMLGNEMNEMAYSAAEGVEVILLVVDSKQKFGPGDEFLIEKIKNFPSTPIIIDFNKIDLVNINEINILKNIYKEKLPDAIQIETVALDKFNIDDLLKTIKKFIQEGPMYYGEKEITDKDVIFQIKEIIREKALELLKQEVPHAIAIYMEDIDWESSPLLIKSSIIVEKDSQKGIVIGENGKMIKRIGKSARKDIENLLHEHVYLELNVKVDEDWRNKKSSIKKFGYKADKQ
ncbi:MAG: GTPase Era [Bacilli bacterium]